MSGIRKFILKFVVLGAMLLGLPLLGVFLAGHPVSRYLEFPPKTRYVQQAPFSWVAFGAYALSILAVIILLTRKARRSRAHPATGSSGSHPFRWWGWLGLFTGLISWILAWTRFDWFAQWQPLTFTPLWFSFILVINALCYRRTGRCLMTDRPGYFLLLFAASAVFWWFFEYLNRFVQNWHYIGPAFSFREYFWYATLPFSTVLPAVLSTRQWFLSARWLRRRYDHYIPFTIPYPQWLAVIFLMISAVGLAGIGVWPNLLFPLLWVSPLLIIISLQVLMKEHHILEPMSAGNWSPAVSAVLAALFCGWFWEMWNYFSLAKWQYSIPFVQRYQIFEMPLLGYAGYLPFGLECAVVGGMLDEILGNRPTV
jgi:hypothetical protein